MYKPEEEKVFIEILLGLDHIKTIIKHIIQCARRRKKEGFPDEIG
jgi:hypothetical protein